MNYDLTKYIEEAKTEAEKMIQRRNAFRPSFLNKVTQIFRLQTENFQELEKNEAYQGFKYNDKAKLYKTYKMLRFFYILRHQCLQKKHQKDLDQKNQTCVSSELLWNKIKDLEKNEQKIKDLLINSEKQIAVLERQNLILKRMYVI